MGEWIVFEEIKLDKFGSKETCQEKYLGLDFFRDLRIGNDDLWRIKNDGRG